MNSVWIWRCSILWAWNEILNFCAQQIVVWMNNSSTNLPDIDVVKENSVEVFVKMHLLIHPSEITKTLSLSFSVFVKHNFDLCIDSKYFSMWKISLSPFTIALWASPHPPTTISVQLQFGHHKIRHRPQRFSEIFTSPCFISRDRSHSDDIPK